ncbi:MAG TPA: hypothetical protein VGS10_11145 [Terracidiphilus sp.]|nr:hypothetical protein [Terracidiphilus sp.]
MSLSYLTPLARRAGFFCVAVMVLTGAAFASSSASQPSSQTQISSPAPTLSASNWSSSLTTNQLAEFRAPEASAALPSAPAPAAAAGQNDNSGGMFHQAMSHFAFEAGFGFNPPISDSIGNGWNLLIGAGVHVTPNFTVPIEYQFIHDGLAQYIINEAGSQGGNVHLWSFGLDPIYDFFPKASNDFYVHGGGGFYRKVTNFTNPTISSYCSYFYGCYGVTVNQVVGHFSSNSGGFNLGGGYYHRFGGIYGTGKMKFFAEARYLDVLTPAVTKRNPTTGGSVTSVPADTKLIPVTFGFSW